jgi:hypothetical protein
VFLFCYHIALVPDYEGSKAGSGFAFYGHLVH